MNGEIVVLSGVRTAIGGYGGSLKDLGTVTIASLSQKKGTLSVHYNVD